MFPVLVERFYDFEDTALQRRQGFILYFEAKHNGEHPVYPNPERFLATVYDFLAGHVQPFW